MFNRIKENNNFSFFKKNSFFKQGSFEVLLFKRADLEQ